MKYAVALCAALAATCSAEAATIAEIRKFDFDFDGRIETGREADSLKSRLWDRLSDEQKSLMSAIDDPALGGKGLPVEQLAKDDFEAGLKERCADDKQRFFLRRNMFDVNVLDRDLASDAAKGAFVSFSGNPSTGVINWDVRGAAAYVLRKRCPTNAANYRPGDLLLSGWAVAPYLSFNGRGTSNVTGSSTLEFGLANEFQLFSGGVFNAQQFKLRPYYLTDFQFSGRAYGLEANWTPVHLDSHLNGYIGQEAESSWWWTFTLGADVLRVETAGATGLDTGSYAWLGGEIGFHALIASAALRSPLEFDVNYSLFRDVVTNRSAGMFDISLGLPLSENGATSLVLGYRNGFDRKSLTQTNRYDVSLNVRF